MALRAERLGVEPEGAFALRRTIRFLCEPGVIEAFVQPVVRPADQLVVGYEALARMPLDPKHPPDWWLARAEEVGLRSDLEIACLAAAAGLGPLPEGRLLFVNLSPSLLADPAALGLLDRLPDRLVIELTEQEAVQDYEGLRRDPRSVAVPRVRIAIDDTGVGYSSLRHVIELTPDFLKLDRELVRQLDRDRNRRALVGAMAAFAAEVGTSVIAEGVETAEELEVLRDAEVDLVQGYLLARPGPPWPAPEGPPRVKPDPIDPKARVTGNGAAAESRLIEALYVFPTPGQPVPRWSSTSSGRARSCPAPISNDTGSCGAPPSGACGRSSTACRAHRASPGARGSRAGRSSSPTSPPTPPTSRPSRG